MVTSIKKQQCRIWKVGTLCSHHHRSLYTLQFRNRIQDRSKPHFGCPSQDDKIQKRIITKTMSDLFGNMSLYDKWHRVTDATFMMKDDPRSRSLQEGNAQEDESGQWLFELHLLSSLPSSLLLPSYFWRQRYAIARLFSVSRRLTIPTMLHGP